MSHLDTSDPRWRRRLIASTVLAVHVKIASGIIGSYRPKSTDGEFEILSFQTPPPRVDPPCIGARYCDRPKGGRAGIKDSPGALLSHLLVKTNASYPWGMQLSADGSIKPMIVMHLSLHALNIVCRK